MNVKMKWWHVGKIQSFVVLISMVICINGCEKESSKSMNEFLFEASKNSGLTEDVVAKIGDDDLITVSMPFGANLKSLVATFSFSGKQVTLNNNVQISGVSANDFSVPVEYVITAENNSIRRYTLIVNVSENIISSFAFRRIQNPSLPLDIMATIRNDSIIAVFPDESDITNLIATYTTTAKSVTVDGIKQSSGMTRNDFSSPVEYAVEGSDGYKRTYQVVVKTNSGFAKFWIKKSLNPALEQDIQFVINHKNLTIESSYLRWIDSQSPSRMVVSFEAPGVLVKLGDAVITNGEAVVDFRQPLQFTTTSGNNAPRTYSVTLICPQINASLPILRIEADAPITNKVNYVKAKLEIIGNGINEGLWNFDMEKIDIRLRGNSTLGLPKKPFRIRFPEKHSPLGLNHAKERSWVLLANDSDKTLIRNAVALQMSRIMQSDATYRRFSACTQFVDLYLNGMYEGNYHLTDQVQVAPGRVEVQSLRASDAGDPTKITGGYLLEFDGFADSEPFWFTTSRGMKVTVKHPDSDDYAPEQKTWIINYMATIENVLFSQNFKDPTTGWRKYIDQASWVDYCIINEMSGNPDAWWSTYMSKERHVEYFVMGPVWDFDIAFNNDNRVANATTRLMSEGGHRFKIWLDRYMLDETFKAAMKARWNVKKGELLNLTEYVDELALLLDMSQKANFKRWNISHQALGHANPPPSSYQEAINQLKNYIKARYNYLDSEFNKW